MARTRRNVWRLNDDTLLWYGRAVAAMQGRPITDPTSWRYQAAIHDYVPEDDPLAQPGEQLPDDADQFWRQCQHGSWFFLPWHRMYLYHFESIVAAAVRDLGGPDGWSLPYWNYSESAASSLLPTAFRNPTLADGSPNALYVADREEACNAGQPFAGPRDVDVRRSLIDPAFDAVGEAGASSFGGPITAFEHSGEVAGALETTPHGNIHMRVGGDPRTGWMAVFHKAALDPIFWLHHANIDRLWTVWLRRSNADRNPQTNQWLNGVAFPFHDASGNVVRMTPAQVVDSTAAPLSYAYDDTSDPVGRAGVPFAHEVAVPSKRPPEMVGATLAPFDLAGSTTHATVPVAPAKTAARFARVQEAPTAPRRVFLNVEHLTATGPACSYDVYLNVPEGQEPHQHEDLFVERLPMFGVAEASRARKGGSGLRYAIDVTDVYEKLAAQPGFDASKVRVSFVPVGAAAGEKISVGRVSLYFE